MIRCIECGHEPHEHDAQGERHGKVVVYPCRADDCECGNLELCGCQE